MRLSQIPDETVQAVAREALRRGLMEVELADVDSSRLAKELLTRRKRPGGKMRREKAQTILQDLAMGATWKQAAAKHGVSVSTVARLVAAAKEQAR